MDITTLFMIVTGVISGASVALKVIAPLTKTKKDDKILKILLTVLRVLSVHTTDNNKVNIQINNK